MQCTPEIEYVSGADRGTTDDLRLRIAGCRETCSSEGLIHRGTHLGNMNGFDCYPGERRIRPQERAQSGVQAKAIDLSAKFREVRARITKPGNEADE